MTTAEEEHFLRSSLLLLKGSLFITKKILLREEQREIQQTGRDIDDLLKTYKQKLEKRLKNYKQRAILFPQSGKSKVENWDISLLTGVLLIVFQSSLSDDERKAVKHIKYQRNEIYAHTAEASLSVEDYDDICSELKAAYGTLASGFDSDVKEQCNDNVEICLKGPLDLKSSLEQLKKMSETDDMFREILTKIDTSGKETTLALTKTFRQESSALKRGISMDISRSENNICNTLRDLHIKKEDLQEMILNALRQLKEEKRVTRKVKVVDSELEVSGNENDQPSVDEAEEILLRVTNEAIRRAKTSEEYTDIREKIQEILDNIECQTDLKALSAEKGCVLIRFDCTTYEQLFSLIIYMENKDMKECLDKLAVSLSRRLNTKDKLHVSFCLSFKTLQSIVQELEANCRREYKRSIRIPIKFESVQGMVRLFDIFEGGGLTNNLDKLSEALTEKVGAKINVKSSINKKQLMEALEEFGSTDYVAETTMHIDKAKEQGCENRGADHKEEKDVDIEGVEEKTNLKIQTYKPYKNTVATKTEKDDYASSGYVYKIGKISTAVAVSDVGSSYLPSSTRESSVVTCNSYRETQMYNRTGKHVTDKSTGTEICIGCLLKGNEKKQATHFCKTCDTYGRYICYTCMVDHNLWTGKHHDVLSLSADRKTDSDWQRKEIHPGKTDYYDINRWVQHSVPDDDCEVLHEGDMASVDGTRHSNSSDYSWANSYSDAMEISEISLPDTSQEVNQHSDEDSYANYETVEREKNGLRNKEPHDNLSERDNNLAKSFLDVPRRPRIPLLPTIPSGYFLRLSQDYDNDDFVDNNLAKSYSDVPRRPRIPLSPPPTPAPVLFRSRNQQSDNDDFVYSEWQREDGQIKKQHDETENPYSESTQSHILQAKTHGRRNENRYSSEDETRSSDVSPFKRQDSHRRSLVVDDLSLPYIKHENMYSDLTYAEHVNVTQDKTTDTKEKRCMIM